MIDQAQVIGALSRFSLSKGVDQAGPGHLRITTALRYPDGSNIDVFIPRSPQAALPFTPVRITDFGQTTEFLVNMGVRPWLSAKRRAFQEDALRTYGVDLVGGAIQTDVADPSELPDAVLRVAQAALRSSDLIFTRRVSLQGDFAQEFEEVLEDVDVAYEPDAQLAGPTGKMISVDFLVRGTRSTSAVLTISAATATLAHGTTVEAFRKFYDLQKAQGPEQRISVLDDRGDRVKLYREDDIERLSDVSTVMQFSDRQQLATLLAA